MRKPHGTTTNILLEDQQWPPNSRRRACNQLTTASTAVHGYEVLVDATLQRNKSGLQVLWGGQQGEQRQHMRLELADAFLRARNSMQQLLLLCNAAPL